MLLVIFGNIINCHCFKKKYFTYLSKLKSYSLDSWEIFYAKLTVIFLFFIDSISAYAFLFINFQFLYFVWFWLFILIVFSVFRFLYFILIFPPHMMFFFTFYTSFFSLIKLLIFFLIFPSRQLSNNCWQTFMYCPCLTILIENIHIKTFCRMVGQAGGYKKSSWFEKNEIHLSKY